MTRPDQEHRRREHPTAEALEGANVAAQASGGMLIGEVAGRTGLTQRTLRYYEELGLLPPAPRLEGGFRLYSEADIQRLEHILELKRLLGFSLLEIKELVEAEEERRGLRQAYRQEPDRDARRAQLARVLEIARLELSRLDQHAAELERFRKKVQGRIARYEADLADLGGSEPAASAQGERGSLGQNDGPTLSSTPSADDSPRG